MKYKDRKTVNLLYNHNNRVDEQFNSTYYSYTNKGYSSYRNYSKGQMKKFIFSDCPYIDRIKHYDWINSMEVDNLKELYEYTMENTYNSIDEIKKIFPGGIKYLRKKALKSILNHI